MSETPLTDKAKWTDRSDRSWPVEVVTAEFARTLETRCAELLAALKQIVESDPVLHNARRIAHETLARIEAESQGAKHGD